MASASRKIEPIAFETGWTGLSGRILPGGYELQEILAADEWQANLKVRVLGDRELDCVAHFFRLPKEIADRQVTLWETTRELRHPNLSAPLGVGALEIEGETAAYAVVRRADESLNAVLAERPLAVDEAHEAIHSVARGLEALHLNGLAHGCLSPSQVLAVGDAIKLPVGCVRALGVLPSLEIQKPSYLAPESTGENLTAEADLWCLGATVFEALTQRVWSEDRHEQLDGLPQPFAAIAMRCLERDPSGRATLGEVVALLSGKLKPTPRVQIAPAPVVAAASPLESAVVHDRSLPDRPAAPPRVYIRDESNKAAGELLAAQTSVAEQAKTSDVPAARVPTVAAEIRKSAGFETPSVATLASVVQSTQALPEVPAAVPLRTVEDVRPTLVSRPRWEDVVGSGTAAETEDDHGSTQLWIWAVAALLVVVGLIWVLRPKTDTAARKAPVAAAASSATKPANPTLPTGAPPAGQSAVAAKPTTKGTGNAWETRTLQPDGTAPQAETPITPAKVAAGKPLVGKPSAEPWRLVLYTYRSQEDATRKANSLNSSHADLHCAVFSPSGSGGPYLVVAGGRMSREQAAQLRRKAVSLGMPHDSYIQNYNH